MIDILAMLGSSATELDPAESNPAEPTARPDRRPDPAEPSTKKAKKVGKKKATKKPTDQAPTKKAGKKKVLVLPVLQELRGEVHTLAERLGEALGAVLVLHKHLESLQDEQKSKTEEARSLPEGIPQVALKVDKLLDELHPILERVEGLDTDLGNLNIQRGPDGWQEHLETLIEGPEHLDVFSSDALRFLKQLEAETGVEPIEGLAVLLSRHDPSRDRAVFSNAYSLSPEELATLLVNL